MLRSRPAILALLSLTAALTAQASTLLPVVNQYNLASQPEIWRDTPKYAIPAELVDTLEIETPSMAYQEPFRHVFLQNEHVIVCEQDCSLPQKLAPLPTREGNFIVTRDMISAKKEKDREIVFQSFVRQATVYHWVTELFRHIQAVDPGYKPKRLMIRTDRVVHELETGAQSTNNAFFLDTDWSLNFLPAENHFFTSLIYGRQRPSAYDPSVAIHEATHSVFEQLIGPILNPEIYGLHEAFADYFAHSMLESPEIGQVMLSGRSLRSVSQPLKYIPNMEAHDLGNVVSSALWAIREKIADRALTDRVALDTIREVSDELYASAGFVRVALRNALAKNGATEEMIQGAEEIWDKSGLGVMPESFVRQAIQDLIAAKEKKVDWTRAARASFKLESPEWAVREWSVPPVEQTSFSLLDTFKGPEIDPVATKWYLVALGGEAPIWILTTPKLGTIHVALTHKMRAISKTSLAFKRLEKIAAHLHEIIAWNETFGAEYRSVLTREDMEGIAAIVKAAKVRTSEQTLALAAADSGERIFLPMTEHALTLKPALRGRAAMLLGGKQGRETIRSMKELKLYTVSTRDLKAAEGVGLPEIEPGETFVGWQLELSTGLKKSVMLEEIPLVRTR